tara:strand:+ start:153 stop:338 length:186 start_codon:yes stop_codon:yes gene_type:complete
MIRFVQVFGERATMSWGYFTQDDFNIFSLMFLEFYYSGNSRMFGLGFCLPYIYSAGLFFRI